MTCVHLLVIKFPCWNENCLFILKVIARETPRACLYFSFHISKSTTKESLSQIHRCEVSKAAYLCHTVWDFCLWCLGSNYAHFQLHWAALGEVVLIRWMHSFLLESPELSSFQALRLLLRVSSFENRVGVQTALKLIGVVYYFCLIKSQLVLFFLLLTAQGSHQRCSELISVVYCS